MPAAIRRHLINSPQRVIDEALDGFARTNPQLVAWEAENNLISRRTKSVGKVGLVSGGGSGHEPLHGGFVGVGMLDVAVCGAIFASPSGAQVYAGTALANSGRGVVQIIKNYTGDVLNFQIGASLAEDDGIEVGQILVDDDLASQGDKDGPGRRGTAAVVTIEKICGALAERGAPVDLVTSLGRKLVDRSRSLAVALTAGTHPGDDRAAFELDTLEVEFGVGIHGERGTARIPFAPVDQLVEQLVAPPGRQSRAPSRGCCDRDSERPRRRSPHRTEHRSSPGPSAAGASWNHRRALPGRHVRLFTGHARDLCNAHCGR